MQAHLLRVIEERTIRPVGSNRESEVDVRIVAASNRDLGAEVEAGRFREDLYYRLNVLSMRMPALRDRCEDIPQLVEYFVSSLAREMGLEIPVVHESDLLSLMDYRWPGNVRELRNVIERCLLLNARPGQCISGSPSTEDASPGADASLAGVEKRHILRILNLEQGNKSAAARQLGIARKTLERKLKEWGAG